MTLKTIRSGGQNGADIGGVRAAKKSGKVQYCGTMPNGFRTLDGPKPEYAAEFNMAEHSSPNYPPRTYENVKVSDGTIRLAVNINSAGERCTLKAINQYGRPYFDVHIQSVSSFALPPECHPSAAAKWIVENNIAHLNVAGNSEQTAPGIEAYVERYITALINEVEKLSK
jgi:hypothetical protein